jgi:hypothetical protein
MDLFLIEKLIFIDIKLLKQFEAFLSDLISKTQVAKSEPDDSFLWRLYFYRWFYLIYVIFRVLIIFFDVELVPKILNHSNESSYPIQIFFK